MIAESADNQRLSLSDAQPADWARIVEALRPFVKDNRMERLSRVVGSRRAGLHLVLENIHDPHNAAAVLRTAEGLGIQHVHIVETINEFQVPAQPARTEGRGAQKGVAMGCSRWLSIRRYRSSLECVEALRAQGVSVFASDCPPSESDSAEAILAAGGGKVGGEFRHALRTQCPARPLGELPISTGEVVALVFGNERRGVSSRFLEAADATFYLPMAGFTQSFNISVAAAIALQAALATGAFPEGTLSGEQQAEVLGRWLLRDVKAARPILRQHGIDLVDF